MGPLLREGLMHRPELSQIPLEAAMLNLTEGSPGQLMVTMSIGQWDYFLQAAYEEDCILLELDDAERPVRAYRRPKC